MGSHRVVVVFPQLQFPANFRKGKKLVGVQTFVTESAVEAFDVGILHGFPRSNEVQLDATTVRPSIQFPGHKLAAIIDRDGSRHSTAKLQLIDHVIGFQRKIRRQSQAFAAVEIEDRKDAEPLTSVSDKKSMLQRSSAALACGRSSRVRDAHLRRFLVRT